MTWPSHPPRVRRRRRAREACAHGRALAGRADPPGPRQVGEGRGRGVASPSAQQGRRQGQRQGRCKVARGRAVAERQEEREGRGAPGRRPRRPARGGSPPPRGAADAAPAAARRQAPPRFGSAPVGSWLLAAPEALYVPRRARGGALAWSEMMSSFSPPAPFPPPPPPPLDAMAE